MALIDLSGDEGVVIVRALSIEALRQNSLAKMENEKRRPNYEAIITHEKECARLNALKEKVIASFTTPTKADAAAAAAARATTAATTDVSVRSGRGRRALQPRQQD